MSDENFFGSVGTDTHLRIGRGADEIILASNLGGTGLIIDGVQISGPGSSSIDSKTSLYVPSPTTFQATRAALARARNGGKACRVICKGDSTTLGTISGTNPGGLGPKAISYVERARRTLNGSQIFGGANLVREGIVLTIMQGGDTDARWTLGSGWSVNGGFFIATSAASGDLTFTDDGSSGQQCDSFIVFIQNQSTTFTYKINGGAAQTVTTSTVVAGAPQGNFTTITVAAGAANSIAFQPPASGTLTIVGVQPVNSTVPHLMDLTRQGVSGATLAAFTSGLVINAGQPLYPYLGGLAPDLYILMMGINDGLAANTAAAQAAYGTNLANLIAQAKVYNSDVALVTFPDYGYFNGSTLATAANEAKPWHAQIYAAANAYDCAVIDLANRWGYTTKPLLASGNNLGAPAGVYLLYNGVHPSIVGYQEIGQMLATILGALA